MLRFPFFYDSLPFRGASDPSTGGPFNTPRSPSRSWAPVLSPGSPRAAVWGGRGVNPRPRETSGRRESQLFLGYVITEIFSKIHLDITTSTTTTTTEQHDIIRMIADGMKNKLHYYTSIMETYFWAPGTEFFGRKYAFYSAGRSKTPVDSSGCSP